MYKSKGDKDVHIQLVKDYFLRYKIACKSDLAKTTHLSLATITNILKELEINSFIKRIEDLDSTGGRKPKQYMICGQYMLLGLISLRVVKDHVHSQIRIVDLNHQIMNEQEYIDKTFTVEQLKKRLQYIKDKYSLLYMSLSIPAVVDDGYTTQSDIPELENYQLKQEIENSLDVCIHIENDVNTALLGYISIEDVKEDPIVFIYQPESHDSGCALYINQQLVYGKSHFSGELGYLPFDNSIKSEATDEHLLLLVKQIVSLIAIVNPRQMIIYAPHIDKSLVQERIGCYIPKQHHPVYRFIDSINEYIMSGLNHQCIEKTKYRKEEKRR